MFYTGAIWTQWLVISENDGYVSMALKFPNRILSIMSTRGTSYSNENSMICGTEPDQTSEPSKIKLVYSLTILKGKTTISHNVNIGIALGILGY